VRLVELDDGALVGDGEVGEDYALIGAAQGASFVAHVVQGEFDALRLRFWPRRSRRLG
jgi:hypothetical protein